MPPKTSRKRKKTLVKLAEEMRQKKRAKNDTEDTQQQSQQEHSTVTTSTNLDESLQLPGPSGMAILDERESDGEEYHGEFTCDDARTRYEDWLLTLEKEHVQMMAMMLYDNYVVRFGLLQTKAAEEVALLLGVNEKTVRRWRYDWMENNGSFSESSKGKYRRYVVFDDEEYRDNALKWIRENASGKGKPNMTAATFHTWLNGNLLPLVRQHHPDAPAQVSIPTATRWLHKLGFNPTSTKKGVYIDGHERQDVVEYRKLYLRKLEVLEATHAPPPPVSDELQTSVSSSRKRLVLIYHDESTFHSNDDQGWVWAEKWSQQIKPKGQGRGLMVSDFIEEHNGYLKLTDTEYEEARSHHPNLWKEARYILKYGTDSQGYWNSEKFMNQVKQAVTIAEIKYPQESNTIVFLFDQSSGHTAYDSDSLHVVRMNVNPGGGQPAMRDTTYNGRVYKLVDSNGVPKGMRQVLIERGVDVRGMKAPDMRRVLREMPDFKYERSKVEKYLCGRGHRAIFIPKFHCEINPIERCWGAAKHYTRQHCDYTFNGLERTIERALNSVPIDLIRKYFRKAREIMRAYREGHTPGRELEIALKQYKSHRSVSATDIQ